MDRQITSEPVKVYVETFPEEIWNAVKVNTEGRNGNAIE